MKPLAAFLLALMLLVTSCNREEETTPGAEENLRDAAVADALNDFDRGRFESALEKVENVLKEHPGDPGAMRVKSMVLASLERFEDAASVLEKLAAREPDDLDIHHILGTAYFKQALWEKAAKHLEKSMKAANRRAKAREFLVVCYEKLGRIDRSISLLEQMLREQPDDPILLTHTGNLLATSRKYEAALKHFQKALEGEPKLPAAYHGLAMSQGVLEKFDDVIRTLDAAIREFPKEPGFRVTLAQTYLQLGRPLDALTAIEQLEGIAGESRETELLRNTAQQMLRVQGKPVPPK